MVYNQEFLKRLTVLYVEDDEYIRETFYTVFSKLFKEVILSFDGEDGLEKYKTLNKQKQFDMIISDINMPRLSGLEMLHEIRKLDADIPFIFTTAYTDSNYLLDAINSGVTHYAVKPVDVKKLILLIQDICTSQHMLEQLQKTQKSNQIYLDIINKVAIVSQTDVHGDIVYVNDIFCEVSGYTKDELLGTNQRIVRHQDMPTEFFDTLWETIRAGEIWHGKIKNKAKDGTSYYVDAHIFPIYDDESNIEGWMGVRFLITKSEQEKQKFQKNVLNHIKKFRDNEEQLKNKLVEFEAQQQITANIDIIQESIKQERKKTKTLLTQLKFREESNVKLKNKLESFITESNKKATISSKVNQENALEIVKKDKLIQALQEDKQIKTEAIEKLTEESLQKTKRINDLLEVVAHLESK